MPNLLGNERNLKAARESEQERREFQIRVVCICSGFFAGVIITVIAFAPMINK